MEVYQVRVFLEVARHLSFTEAAEVLNLTQPAVSAKIKSLEIELGAELFDRTGRKVQLTEVGLFLSEAGPKLIEVETQLLQTISEIKQGKFGCLNVGGTGAIAEGWLPEVLFQYRQQYPTIQTNCQVYASAEALYRALASQEIDLGISDISLENFPEISAQVVDQIQYRLLVSPSHALATKSWLSLRDLQQYPWVLLPQQASSRLQLETRLAELGLSLNTFAQVETVDTLSLMRTYLLQGNYLGFASSFEFTSECQAGLLSALPLQEFSLPGQVFLFTRPGLQPTNPGLRLSRSRHGPAQKFIDLVQQSRQDRVKQQGEPDLQLRSPSLALLGAPTRRPETLTLRIGVQNTTIPTITAGLVMQRLGLLEHFLPRSERYNQIQYNIQWQDFLSGAPIIAGLHQGQLDIGVLGDYPLLLSALSPTTNADPPQRQTRLVSFISTNPDGTCNAVIVPQASKLEHLGDLRGRVIAVPFRSSAHGMVLRSLHTTNLLQDVKLAALDGANPAQLLERLSSSADGYAHFAPFHEIACYKGKFRYLPSAAGEPLPAFHGVVASETLIAQYPEIVTAYLQALAAAQNWYRITGSAADLVSQWTGLEANIVARILSGAYDQTQPGRFLTEMTIRPDWIQAHIAELSQIPGNEALNQINLDSWIQAEFLETAQKR